MASNVFNNALQKILAAYLVTGADIRAALLMSNTTADTEKDGIDFVDDITTLDECDAAGYARVQLGSEASNVDNTNDRAEFDASDISFTGLGGDATRNYVGVLLVKHVTNDTDSIPIAFIEFDNAPISSAATQVDVPWNAEGILQLAQA